MLGLIYALFCDGEKLEGHRYQNSSAKFEVVALKGTQR